MTQAEATAPTPYLRDGRPPADAAPQPSWRERIVTWLGYRVYEPPAKPEVEFLESAPELAGAIRSGRARFAHVARAGLLARKGREGEERRVLRREFVPLLEDFEREAGPIRRWYLSEERLLGAALTEDDQISVVIGSDVPVRHPEVVDLVRRCQQVGYAAWHRLAPYDRRQCQEMVFSVVEEACWLLEAAGWPKAKHDRYVRTLSRRLAAAEQFMLRCASRRAQSHYLKGVLCGLALIGLVLGGLTLWLVSGDEMTQLRGDLLLVATAGAVGAAISVPMRMTSGSFRMNLPTLNAEMKRTDVRLVAALRPAMGLVLALATYAVVLAGLVPVDEVGKPDEQTALYAAIGFLAGFTERFAQDMFVRSGNGVQGVMGDSPSSGPSAGLSPPPGAQAERAAPAWGTAG